MNEAVFGWECHQMFGYNENNYKNSFGKINKVHFKDYGSSMKNTS